jgi:hypothetical protein
MDSSDSSDEGSGSSPNGSSSSRLVHVPQPERTQMALVPTMPAVVPTTIEDQGLRFFFTRFVSAISGMTGDVPSGLDSSPFLKAILMQLPLRDATISVGLAAMSNVSQDRALSLAAREKYVAAINVVRTAVQNPELANANQTFQIIIMLTLYEV